MKQLNTKPIYRTYYVNSNIIYNIVNSTAATTDIHALIYKEGSSFPVIRYQDKKEVNHIFYLDSLIGDGDKLIDVEYQGEILPNKGFRKVCHEITGEPEKKPYEYFKYLCEQQIAKTIADNNYPYSHYYDSAKGVNKLEELGVPSWMFKQNLDKLVYRYGNLDTYRMDASDGAILEDIYNNLIDFTEAKYNSLLNDEIFKRAKDAANNAVKRYGKKVNTLTLTNI